MKPKLKVPKEKPCFRVHITEKCSGYEFGCTVIFRTDDSPDDYLEDILRAWRGDSSDSESDGGDGYFLCGGEILVEAGSIEEISKEDFEVLNRNGISEL